MLKKYAILLNCLKLILWFCKEPQYYLCKKIIIPRIKTFTIKESNEELKILKKKQKPFLATRIRILIICKKHEQTGISKTDLAKAVGVNHNSVTKWRSLYIKDGLNELLTYGKIGFKPSILGKDGHLALLK